MFEKSVVEVMSKIKPSDLVLDVGGWACPFNRADWVLDAEPFETRGFYKTVGMPGFQGPEVESFSKRTWVQRDICDKEPWPFKDKQFDWAICSHVLEDIRDPIYVCKELSRVSKRGYIEVPSRLMESCRGHEGPRTVGLSHHRWLIELAENGSLKFQQKYHFMHSHWRFSFPKSFMGKLLPHEKVLIVWWDNSISASELLIHGLAAQQDDAAEYIKNKRPYSQIFLNIDLGIRKAWSLYKRIINKLIRILSK